MKPDRSQGARDVLLRRQLRHSGIGNGTENRITRIGFMKPFQFRYGKPRFDHIGIRINQSPPAQRGEPRLHGIVPEFELFQNRKIRGRMHQTPRDMPFGVGETRPDFRSSFRVDPAETLLLDSDSVQIPCNRIKQLVHQKSSPFPAGIPRRY